MLERIKTALVLLLVVGVAMFATRSWVLILPLLLTIATVSAYEWAKMLPKSASHSPHYPYIYASSVLVISSMYLFFYDVRHWFWLMIWGVASLLWLFVIVWVSRFPKGTQAWYGKRLIWIGLLMILSTVSAMFFLWQQSAWWLLYVFVLVWCADSGAYFVGRKFGKTKMSPAVSPNKSLEGLYGGLATGALVVVLVSVGWLKLSGSALFLFIGLSLLTIVMSVFGDLFESMLKRQAGIKDSGTILPGHGGVLDRIDSQLSAMPIFALGFWLMDYYQFIDIQGLG